MRLALQLDLVINRRARHVLARPALIDTLRSMVGARRTHVTETPTDMEAVATDLAERGTDLVLIAGGDGSLTTGVTALCKAFPSEQLPPISPIPTGTTCTIARNWGIAGPPEQCLKRLIGGSRRLVPRGSLRVLAHHGDAQQERIGFIFGTGLVARFFDHYYARGARGYRGAARLVARIFAESFVGGPLADDVLAPMPCELSVDGQVRAPAAWSLICCSTVPNLGIHMMLTYRAGEDLRRPHLVASPLPPKQLGPRAPRVLAGRSLGGEGLVDTLAKSLRVTFRGPEPGGYVLDGELEAAHAVDVAAGPLLTVATPC